MNLPFKNILIVMCTFFLSARSFSLAPDDPFDLYDVYDAMEIYSPEKPRESPPGQRVSDHSSDVITNIPQVLYRKPPLSRGSRFVSPHSLRNRVMSKPSFRDRLSSRVSLPLARAQFIRKQTEQLPSIPNIDRDAAASALLQSNKYSDSIYDNVNGNGVSIQQSAPLNPRLQKNLGLVKDPLTIRETKLRQEKELLEAQFKKLIELKWKLKEYEAQRLEILNREVFSQFLTAGSQSFHHYATAAPEPLEKPLALTPQALPSQPVQQYTSTTPQEKANHKWYNLSNPKLRPSLYRYNKNSSLFRNDSPTLLKVQSNRVVFEMMEESKKDESKEDEAPPSLADPGGVNFKIDLGPIVDAIIMKELRKYDS